MIRSLIITATLAGLSAPAAAAIGTGAPTAVPRAASEQVQLAQSRQLQVFYDEYGRRVLVDPFSGEIVAIEEPDRRNASPWEEDRRILREDRRDDGRGAYNLDDPYERDLYIRETGRDPDTGQPVDDYRGRADNRYERYPREGEQVFADPIERRSLGEALPEAPTGATAPSDVPSAYGSREPVAPVSKKASEEVAKLQILLDRAGASPGVIDGHDGSNVRKALLAYEELTGETLPIGNAAALDAALAASGGPAFIDYTITSEDVAAPMVASIPDDYGEKAKLDHLSYTSATEMLGERFHMDEGYLKALNPEADFNRVGTIIRVASVGQNVSTAVDRIVADKGRKQVRAYDAQGNLVAAYPTTIGSGDTPSPTGTHQVERIAFDPGYTYNPKKNFQQGENDKILEIPPGPNGPVGTIWIALSKPTYGIHGTPEPSKIGKTESHGCVRLTNWDAAELAKLVKKGVFVQFIEGAPGG